MVKSNAASKSRISEGQPVDLFRERTPFCRRPSNNYQLGSNIPCLHSHDLEPREPPRPSHRVRDIGREIMIKSNKCSWYQGMMEDEAEVLGERAPVERRSHVRHRTTPSLFPTGEPEHTESGKTDPSPKPVQTELPPKPVPADHVLNPSPLPATIEASLIVADKDHCVRTEPVPLVCSEIPLITSSSSCSEAIGEANLCLLKRLEEQQIALMKQQQALSERIGRQITESRLNAISSDSCIKPPFQPQIQPQAQAQSQPSATNEFIATPPIETSSTPELSPSGNLKQTPIIPSASSARYDVASQRRLKGAVARRCAQRDEGSIKNLIWYQDDEDDSDGNNNRSTKGSVSTSSVGSRRESILPMQDSPPMRRMKTSCAVRAESSKTVQDLLANSFSSTFF